MNGHLRRHLLTPALLGACLLGACLLGCRGGPVSHMVDPSFLRGVSHAGRIAIYDAENEIMVARDQLDAVREQLAALKGRRQHAAERLKLAGERGSPPGVELAQAWVRYLDSMRAWLNAELITAEAGVQLAYAGLELTKADVIQREDLVPGKDFTVADYRAQQQRYLQAQQAQAERAVALKRKMEEDDANWWTVRRRYVAQTGDSNRGLWID